MKIVILAALVAAVASVHLSGERQPQNKPQWPWQVGNLYRYDVETRTLARHEEGSSTGNAFKARLIVRAKAPGQLLAKLENPKHAQVHQELPDGSLPDDLDYKPVSNFELPFEINLKGGRVLSLKLPSAFPLSYENFLKGLFSTLQVDLSHRRSTDKYHYYDQQLHQGQFSKLETDVTGDCETLYTVSHVAAEWRRELPLFVSEEDPIEVTKSKNYDRCHHRIAYHFGVPNTAEWQGKARKNQEEQLLQRASSSRMLVGKEGTIYKAETTSKVFVNALKYGKQKTSVHSNVRLDLLSYEQDSEQEWQLPENNRNVNSLLYATTTKKLGSRPGSPTEHSAPVSELGNNRVRRSYQGQRPLGPREEIARRHSKESSVSSGSSEPDSHVNEDVPSMTEPASTTLYMQPENEKDKKQYPMNAQKLAQEIAQLLQNPNNMPKSDLLGKFNILVRVITAMTYEQLQQTSRSIEAGKTSNDSLKLNIWKVYRDAVTQAGNFPAFQQIKSWIIAKKIEGEEAAEVVASLATTMRYPTKKLMTEFFNLALHDEVRQQKYLNDTMLIAATKFINMGQVDNHTAHTYYPSQMYGRLCNKYDRFVPEEIIPRLGKELQKAIEHNDSHKAQVYIRAIGNLGHRDILYKFAPYLEGKIPVSTYLRTMMVTSLNVLARNNDRFTLSALYSILKNTAENYEVRLAAAYKLFEGQPTLSMLEGMAEMTHTDPSIHVRAGLKSTIKSAAKLSNPRYMDLARSAQAVESLLTKEEFGLQHSSKHYLDSYEYEQHRGIFGKMAYIASKDSLFPKSLWASLTSSELNQENMITGTFSSVRKFFENFRAQMSNSDNQDTRSELNLKFSAHTVAEQMNINRDPESPQEFAVHYNLFNQERFFAMGETELTQLQQSLQQYLGQLSQGVKTEKFDYLKFIYQDQMTIMFPTAAGMPFIFKYKVPTVFYIKGIIKGEMKIPTKDNRNYLVNLDKELQVTIARNIDGKVGFLDTFTDKYAFAGVGEKLQWHLPVKVNMQLKDGEFKVKLQQLRPDQDTTIIHYSVWPYTTCQKKDTLVPEALDSNTKVIKRQNKASSIDYRLGHNTGIQFQLQGNSYSTDYKNLNVWLSRPGELLSSFVHLLQQKDIAQTHYQLRLLGKQSPNKELILSTVYDKLYNQKQDGEPSQTATELTDVAPNSENRRKELIKRVVTGVDTAEAVVLDISAIFNGAQKHEYVFSAAHASSHIDPKIRCTFFAARNSAKLGNRQMNGVSSFTRPEQTTLYYLEALQKELKSNLLMDIKFGENGNINIQGQAERTQKQAELLKKDPWAKQCNEEIAQYNYYQTSCMRMNLLTQTPDYFKASITYKDVSPTFKNMTYELYRAGRHFGFWYSDENSLKSTADGRLEIEVQNSYEDNTLNLAVSSRVGDIHFSKVPLPKVVIPALSLYPAMKTHEKILNHFTRYQYQPFCSVDKNSIRTFSNRTYKYPLTTPWHVVYLDEAKYAGKYGHNEDELLVLAKRPNADQQHVYISYKSNYGKSFEMEMQPGSGPKKIHATVNSNANKISQSLLNIYWDDVEETPLLEYYTLAEGVMMLKIQGDRLRALYDGEKLMILSKDNRNNTRGLCGRMSSEIRNDYLTPHGIVDRPDLFGASFALTKETPHAETEQLQALAKSTAYQQKLEHASILRYDDEWKHDSQYSRSASSSSESKSSESSADLQNAYRTKSYQNGQGPCQVHQQVQFYENHGEICITTEPLSSCQSHCKGEDYTVQASNVVCRPKLDQMFQAYKDQIRQGQNPQVAGVPQIRQFRVPGSCKV